MPPLARQSASAREYIIRGRTRARSRGFGVFVLGCLCVCVCVRVFFYDSVDCVGRRGSCVPASAVWMCSRQCFVATSGGVDGRQNNVGQELIIKITFREFERIHFDGSSVFGFLVFVRYN